MSRRVMFLSVVLALASCRGAEPAAETSGDEARPPARTLGSVRLYVLEEPPPVAETPLDAGVPDAGPASADAADAGPNPWGATRAEQCAPGPRPAMNDEARGRFAEGVVAANRGDLPAAKAAFEEALAADRRAYLAAYNLGVVSDRLGRETEAMDYYRQALRIVPSHEDSVEAIVLLHLRRGRTQDALEFVRPLSVQFSWNDVINATYARVLGALSRWDESFRAARAGLRCNERSVSALTALALAAYGQSNLEMTSWILDRITSVEQSESTGVRFAESHYLRGLVARGRPGQVEAAFREFQLAVQLREDYVDARMALAQLLLATGNYPRALAELEVAARAAPWSWPVRLLHADAMRANGRFDDARAEIVRIQQIAPNQPEVRLSLGLLYLEQANCLRTGDVASIGTCTQALNELGAYRTGMGPRLPPSDRTGELVQSLTRIVQRLNAARDAAEAEARANAESGASDAGTPAEP